MSNSYICTYEEMERRRQQEHLKSAQAKQKARTQKGGELVQLPLFPVSTRGVPNSILRGALFAAVKDGQYIKGELLAAQEGIQIRFTGWQLNQSDLDVWEQALMLANEHPLGTRCDCTARGFLKSIGRSTGGSKHEWLRDSFRRLGSAFVEITHNGLTYGGNMLDFYCDEESKVYRLEINPKLKAIYDAGFTLADWEQRQQLGHRKPLAKWLHGFLASHAKPLPLKVETYMRLSGSGGKRKCKKEFRRSLKTALDELIKIEAITDYEISKGGLVTIKREPSHSQKRHLTRAKPRKGNN